VGLNSGIEWTDATWNPTTGCRRVSAGCDHCYAATLARRLKAMGNPRYQVDGPDGEGFGLTLHWDKLDEPRHWRRPRRVFVDSMSDLFHPGIPDAFLMRVFTVMADCQRHRFQVLTKRPARMAKVVTKLTTKLGGVPPNVWLGTSVESADVMDRVGWLRASPSAVRFLSLEPLLGPLPGINLSNLHWFIVGGESGPGHRPIQPEWVRDIRDQCLAAGVAFFFKQWGGRTPKSGGRLLDGQTWNEFPPEATPPVVDTSGVAQRTHATRT
jgi:protein gp37